MFYRTSAVVVLACLAAGCSDAQWDHTLSYVGLNETAPQPAAQPVVQTSSAPPVVSDDWCVQVGKSVAAEAAEQGFDVPTQRRRAEQATQQCTREEGKS